MSFFGFGSDSKEKQQVDKIGSIMDPKQDEITVKSVTKVIKFDDTVITSYQRIDLADFFDPCWGNIRPRTLKIEVTNYNVDKTHDITMSYIHTPVTDRRISEVKLCNLKVQEHFNEKLTYTVQTPYLTYCQMDEDHKVIDIDMTQVTNVNVTPDRDVNMSMGGVFFQLNRNTEGLCSLEVKYTLSCTFKPY